MNSSLYLSHVLITSIVLLFIINTQLSAFYKNSWNFTRAPPYEVKRKIGYSYMLSASFYLCTRSLFADVENYFSALWRTDCVMSFQWQKAISLRQRQKKMKKMIRPILLQRIAFPKRKTTRFFHLCQKYSPYCGVTAQLLHYSFDKRKCYVTQQLNHKGKFQLSGRNITAVIPLCYRLICAPHTLSLCLTTNNP